MRSKLRYYPFKVRLIITQKILNEKRRRKVEFGCHPNYLIISSKLGWLPPKKFRKKREEGEAEFGWDPNYLIISSTKWLQLTKHIGLNVKRRSRRSRI